MNEKILEVRFVLEGREEHRKCISGVAFEYAEVPALAYRATRFTEKRVMYLVF